MPRTSPFNQSAWMRVFPALSMILLLSSAPQCLIDDAIANDSRERSRSDRSNQTVAVTIRDESHAGEPLRPITGGFPLSRTAGITALSQIEILDATQTAIPAQMKVMSRWGGPPTDSVKPIRWVLLDYQVSLTADQSSEVRVHANTEGNYYHPVTAPITTTDSGSQITVNTGAAEFVITKNPCNFLTRVTVGSTTILPTGQADMVITIDGTPYRSSLGSSSAAIETAGQLRTVVRVTGSFQSNVASYTLWLHFFAGKSYVRAFLRLENNTVCFNCQDRDDFGSETAYISGTCQGLESPGSIHFSDLSITLQPSIGVARSVTALPELAGTPRTSTATTVEIYQDSSGTNHWNRLQGSSFNPRPESYVQFRGYRLSENGTTVSNGDQANGLLDLSDGNGGITIGFRHLWQNYPKSLRANGNQLQLGLFPDAYAGEFRLRAGEYKTHELVLNFHTGGFDASQTRARMTACLNPVVPLPPASHVFGSRVFYDVGLIDRSTPYRAGYEDQVQAIITPASASDAYSGFRPPTYDADSDARTLFESIESLGFYGWMNFGDVPLDFEGNGYGAFNLKYNFTTGMLIQFYRSGNSLWWQLAEAAARHTADIDILHTATKTTTVYWEGGYFGHSFHDRDGIADPHRQSGPPTLDLCHGSPGLLAYYCLTGNEFARQAAIEEADNVRWRWENTIDQNGQYINGPGYATSLEWYDNSQGCLINTSNHAGFGELAARGNASSLLILLEAARTTGETGYLDLASLLVNTYRAEDCRFINGPVPALTGCRIRTWMVTMYLVAVGKYLDTLEEFNRSDTVHARETLLEGSRFFRTFVSVSLDADRRSFPYDWDYDGTGYDYDAQPDPGALSGINAWQLLAADLFAYAYKYSVDWTYMGYSTRHFNTGGPDPHYQDDPLNYHFAKEATNLASFGLTSLYYVNLPPMPDLGWGGIAILLLVLPVLGAKRRRTRAESPRILPPGQNLV